MSESVFYNALLYTFLGLAALTFPFLFFVTAPYGRYTRERWGPKLNRTLGWVLMEAPSPVGFALLFVLGDRHSAPTAIVFLLLWQAHYLHRAFIFPFRLRGDKKRITLITVLMGLTFNLANSYLNGRYLFSLGPSHGAEWLGDPRFLAGVALFVGGLAINLHADTVLINLRRPGEQGYLIPHGGLFRWVSCPNYLGEIVEWCGWALLTWSPPGLAFALWTTANLAPRAYTHHQWYRRQFPDYPKRRRALLPFVLGLAALLCVAGSSGCSETGGGSSGAAPAAVALSSQSSPVRAELIFPEAADLALAASGQQRDVERFAVSREQAERFAQGFALQRGYLAGTISSCLALPVQDGQDRSLSWQLVLGVDPSCSDFSALLQQARELWAQADGPGKQPAVLRLKRAIERSGADFYFIEVAAYTFRHPLREGHRGLPSWVFAAARGELPLSDAGCQPSAVLPPGQMHHYLIRYRCGERQLVYSHRHRRVIPRAQIPIAPGPGDVFSRWQQVVRAKYGAQLERYLTEHRSLWERYLQAAPASGLGDAVQGGEQ